MVLLPHNDVLSGASTEMASEGTPAKVSSVPPPPPAVADTTNTTDTTAPPPPSLTISISTATAANADDVTAKAMFGSAGPLSPYRPSRVKLGSVHPCITCHLCKGYLIDATTIVECLHSFCHSCIMKHLRTEQYCPQCEMMINKAKPNIKPDATLQAIVYKLVPRLYENELRRRRAFYRLHPEMATVATPEQRGEDTEYLIFSPNEKISLSLEYAEKELAEDNEELLKAKYLLCPAVFSIALLKKFIIYKYGISERQFCVEIMYKVKTIILPDYYTLMDVAYIYTWKRDAPMKYYYRIRTTESNPVELPEVALRRSPSLVTALPAQRPSVDEEDDKENRVRLDRIVSEAASNESDSSSSSSSNAIANTPRADASKPPTAAPVTPAPESPATPTQPRKNESIKLKIGLNKNTYVSILQSPQPDEPSTHSSSSSSSSSSASSPGSEGAKSSSSHKSEKSKRKRKDALATLQQMEENSRELKFKIEQMKDTGLVGSKSKSGKSSAKHHQHQQQLALVPYKVELSAGLSQPSAVPEPERSDSKRLHSAKNGSNSASGSSPAYCKLKIKKSSPEDGKQQQHHHHHHPIVLKIDQRSPEMATATLKFGMPRKSEKSMTPSPPPLPPSPPTPPSPKQKFADEKSQFLNSFQLTPIKPSEQSSSPSKTSAAATTTATTTTPPAAVESVAPAGKKSPTSTSSVPPVAAPTNSTSPPASNGTGTTTKRKAKDASSGGGVPRSGPKKPKLSNDEIKAIVEKTVAENIRSPSEHIVPPIFLKPKPPTTTTAAAASGQPSPPLPSSSAPTKAKDPSPKRDSPRPFVFKTPPPPPPPPIVSANNIPAVKPSQQVLPAPVPQKPAPVPIRPALTTAPKPAVPQVPQTHIRKPTAPTKLPTSAPAGTAGVKSASPPAQQPLSNGSQQQQASNATTHSVAAGANRQQKGLELKRAQSNPSINIPPPQTSAPPVTVPRDTEISKLRPEDLKKNQKVYGPEQQQKPNTTMEATGASFAVPGPKAAPKPSSSSAAVPAGNATKSSGSAPAGQGTKARPVNYLNYALLNSKAAAAGSRTPIPSYSSSSPSYSPDSPQYSPNLNFSSKQFKYANPLAYNSHLQNMLNDRRTGSTSPPGSSTSAIPASSPSPPQDRPAATTSNASGNKRPASALSPTADDKKQQPPEKQPALLSAAVAAPNPADKFPSGIPDGLSVTLATDDDDAARIKNVNKQLKNNFIEIRALPEVPITEVKLPLPLPSSSTTTTASKPGRRTPPGKAAAAAGSPGTLSGSPMPRKSSSPSVAAPTYSVAASAPPKTSVSSAAPPPANRPADALQRKIIDLIDKPSPSSSGKTSSKPPPTMPPVSRPSTPKGGGSGSFPPVNSGNKFKLPNATVNENGTLKLNNYREVDLIPKGAAASGPKSAPSPPSGASSRTMPPQTSSASSKSIMPIAPKPSSSQLQSFANGRMAMSPPIQRSPTATSGYQQPKSKTPPSQLPSMASMGPMFDIQMKSAIAAAAASGGGTTPSKKPPTSSTTLTSATVPRRKIVPTSNSTSLVPLKTSPVAASPSTAAGGAGSKLLSSNYSDYITLHPQGPVSSSAPPSRPLFGTPHQQQHAALTQILSENFARQCFNNLPFPYLLQQFAHHQPGATSMGPRGLGSDSVTITASPMGAARGAVSQNSLTVTAIPPGQQGGGGGGSGARGSGGGGLNGPRGGIGGGGPNPASRNSS
uniref:RING-type domain-containing protein n=1 Tax=Anopheles coluzzii TaxID=1518534 RepID=A0A6E8VQZ4_ANOCL